MPDPAENVAQTRELAAIMFSDVCGYTLIMGRDEDAGVRARTEHRELLRSILPKFNGRVVDEAGDGTLSSFRSAVDAVNCARQIQASLKNAAQFRVRIGIHVGDVIVSGNNVIGDGVNVASRIQALAPPGGIFISERVYDDIRNKPDIRVRSLGEKTLKNVTRPIRVYEVTDPALATTAPARVVKRPFVTAVVVVVIAVAAAMVSWKLLRPASTPSASQEAASQRQIRSLAVLPLENLSGDPSQEYFADGMTEELITDLAKISALRVISRTSVMQFKGERKKPLPEIATALNVDAVVEGSVLRVGDKVRITTQLIDARADKHLWAESYERDSRDVLALQGELASQIARKINVELTPQEEVRLASARQVDPGAHEAYLKGRYYQDKYSEETSKKALEYFQQAINLDAGFAPAYTGIADVYTYGVDFFFAPNEVMPKAKADDEKALKLDDNLAEAHSTLGMISYQYDYDWRRGERELKRAVALNSNYADAHHQYGWLLTLQGRFDEATAEMKRGIELDPLSLMNTLDASLPLSLQGKREAAVEQCRKALDLDSNFIFARWVIGQTNAENGHPTEAIAEFEQIRGLLPRPFLLGWLGYAYAASGDRDNALKMIAELNQLASNGYVSPFYVAIVHLGLGDKDQALAGLAKAYEVRSQWLIWLKVDRIFDPLRSDARFGELLKKVGLDK